MNFRRCVKIWQIAKSEQRAVENFAKLLAEIDYLKRMSAGLGSEDIGDLHERLPTIEALIFLARYELEVASHPLRFIEDTKEIRKKILKLTSLRCPNCSP